MSESATSYIQHSFACSGLNLGGIGSGGVELRPDGRFHCWNLMNSRPWTQLNPHSVAKGNHSYPPIQPEVMDTDFFIRIQAPGKRPVYRWLFTGNGMALSTASHFFRHHKYFFIRSFEAIEYKAEYPFITLNYIDKDLPVKVSLTAWTPFIPRDAKNSSLPGFCLDFSVTNKSDMDLDISLVWQQQNLAGYACETIEQEHEIINDGALHMVKMTGSKAEPEHDTSGEMTIWAEAQDGQRITSIACNPYMQNIIWPIHVTGDLEGPLMPPHIDREEMSGNPDVPNKAWLCVQNNVKPGESSKIRMGLGWFFPHLRSLRATPVGHVYSNWFDNSIDVVKYISTKRDELKARSRILPELLLDSKLPEKFALSLLDQLSTLTKCTQFSEEGRFGLQEGHGCCAFNTVDVDHYSSFALSTLFPELRKQVLKQQNDLAHPDNGKIHHGLPGTIEPIPAGGGASDGYSRWDCSCQYTLQVYRDCKWAADTEMMKECYPHAKKAMELVAGMDFYGIGLPYIQGGITYDHWNMVGVVGYMAGVYLAGILALEDMAKVVGDDETAAWCKVKFREGVAGFEEYLYNGEQYLLFYGRRPKGWKPGDDVRGEHKIFDPVKPPQECMPCGCDREPAYVEIGDTGMMTDLLNGNAMAAVLGLGDFLDPERVKKQLKMILERNIQGENDALVNGTYPDEHFLDQWPFMQWQTPWTGTEYFFALQCYEAGMVDEGDRVIDMVFDRHNREGMRWDHAECSNHYARPLSIWGAYAARIGLRYDGYRGKLAVEPPVDNYSGAMILATAMGSMDYQNSNDGISLTIKIKDGSLDLKEITFATELTKAEVTHNGSTVAAAIEAKAIALNLDLNAGDTLSIKVS